VTNQLELIGKDQYIKEVKSFQRMFDKNDDEFRWVLVKMNTRLGYTVMLDNDETAVVFDCDLMDELGIPEWTGKFEGWLGRSSGVSSLLDSLKIPNDTY
jgi:hypothetical protein|tara:strand:+ start:51259 stop:51555 length:297 start_codon:yes stop_codon:yes gene_type:complete